MKSSALAGAAEECEKRRRRNRKSAAGGIACNSRLAEGVAQRGGENGHQSRQKLSAESWQLS
jgi:hypothetical protein